MDGDRKYKQQGYQDSGSNQNNGPQNRDQKPRPQGPRPPLDVTGPRLPRLVQTVTASRCYSCSTTLLEGTDMKGTCPKCNAALHCCKQCAHFEPSTRFQCLKPIPERIAYKDRVNECAMFSPRVTVARDSKASAPPPGQFGRPMQSGGGYPVPDAARMAEPRSANDARAAFDSLFKKP
jgi:hypothetical protein